MKGRLYFVLFAAVLLLPLNAQEKKSDDSGDNEEAEYTAYSEIILEDFETTVYTDKNITYAKTTYQDAKITMRTELPAPGGKSTKYLGVKVKARAGDVFSIKPEKDITIEKFCKSISIWVYGKRFSGELSILLQDAKEQNHRLVFGKLNFLGWRKLTVYLPSKIPQQDLFLNQKKYLKILQIQYRPANRTRLAQWHYFYVDNISAMARDKYTDRQSDDW